MAGRGDQLGAPGLQGATELDRGEPQAGFAVAEEGPRGRERPQEARICAYLAHLQASESPGEAMKRVLLALIASLAIAAPAIADPPARVTIVAVFEPITYGENAYVNGQLLGDGQAGQLVALEQSAPPFTDWTPVAQTTSDAQGYYSFKLHPSQTMQYRTSSQGTPSEKAVQVSLAPRITLKAQPAGKTSVRYSGAFGPALPGQQVAIQRRSSTGAW